MALALTNCQITNDTNAVIRVIPDPPNQAFDINPNDQVNSGNIVFDTIQVGGGEPLDTNGNDQQAGTNCNFNLNNGIYRLTIGNGHYNFQ